MMTPPDVAHDALFCPAVMRLGEIHWFILRADNLLETLVYKKAKEEGANEGPIRLDSLERTDFGKEVGWDEINWWVFKKETDIEELRERTKRALGAVQSLKEASFKLRKHSPDSYDELLTNLKAFAEYHVGEIEVLHEYLCWLASRDVLTPAILFTYRVWGSTRMGDRTLEIEQESLEKPTPATLRLLAEVVLGVRNSRFSGYERAYLDVADDMCNSMDPEGNVSIEIPAASVVQRAAWEAYGDCATYFTCVRDSLRNILLDIAKLIEQRDLIYSDRFWKKFILWT